MNEFYVGYLPNAPAGIRRRVRILVVVVMLLSIAGAVLFASSQKKFADSSFDFGKAREYSGTVTRQPFPMLSSDSPAAPGEPAKIPYLLVAPGKHGADALLSGQERFHVRLRGTLIQREEGHMLEVEPGSVADSKNALQTPAPMSDLGEVTLRGEIVDAKCYLGVMNPGEGKVHRDCAARCLSGGIPPALATASIDGTNKIVLLTTSTGVPLPKSAFLSKVGQPVAIRGQLLQSQGWYYLETDAPGIQPLP